ncbi:MAG: hypothetical protein ACREAZ_04740 [Nitrososphaera sp.]
MAGVDSNSSSLLRQIVANSLFTEKQLSIISKRLQGSRRPENMTSGAYYRQVRQCREKVVAVLYSAVLLQSTGIIQPDGLVTLSRLGQQMGVIFGTGSRDVISQERIKSVMSVTDQLIKRVSRL